MPGGRDGDDPDLAKAHFRFLGRDIVRYRVNLKGNEATGVNIVGKISGGHPVDPGPDAVSDGFHPVMVPVTRSEGRPRRIIAGERVEPLPTLFVIQAAAPGPGRGIDLCLIAMDDAVPIVGLALPPDHHAGVQQHVCPSFVFEDEVSIKGIGDEPVVDFARSRATDQLAVHHFIGRLSANGMPARQSLARGNVLPLGPRLRGCRCGTESKGCCGKAGHRNGSDHVVGLLTASTKQLQSSAP